VPRFLHKPSFTRPVIKEEKHAAHLGYNPWEVSDATAFLKYCCPECDFKNEIYEEFSGHALENHVLATTLFVKADRLECPRL
jgi:hypothetical protein